MPKALLAWEIGGGQGHLHLLSAIAHKLKDYGIEPVFALQNPKIRGLCLPGKILQAPRATMRFLDDKDDDKSYLFSDILYIFGFSTPFLFSFHFQAWRNLINLVRPSLVIADFAPVLVLAAKGIVPTVVVGNGFCIPPAVIDFPALRPFPVPAEAFRRQAEVAETVRQVTGFDAPLGELLNGDRAFIFSIPELDPYKDVRKQAEYVGIHSAPFPQNLGCEGGKFWGYLAKDWQNYSLVVDTLKPECVFDDLKIVLKGKSLAIHHAGFFTSATCLLAGIPQMVFPKDMEKWHTAKALLNLGVAISPELLTQESLVDSISCLPEITQKAQEQAEKFADWNHNFLDVVVQTCLKLAS
ncbi:MAG: hypothetical protein KME60_28985 [Cyanomargarita calcarea GSE-NOS-MK-12-04C]|jgi:hypothetical protein|uniref:Uncharacterized protein n=1 Tax=Cyanomargarita calcarea GSE-NOS-MK-12-04C TaxID=2839659 RepID=A0A951QUW6_9CYAN|nr:hypothetical protein [Cyanomargarita calcarea GSE-NOS-MK-12-04C]